MNSRKITALLVFAFALLVIAGTKVSQLTRTRSLQSTSRFMVSTQDASSGRWSSRYITAPDLATNLGTWITNTGSGGSGEVTTAQLLAASNAVWAAQAAKAPTNNARFHGISTNLGLRVTDVAIFDNNVTVAGELGIVGYPNVADSLDQLNNIRTNLADFATNRALLPSDKRFIVATRAHDGMIFSESIPTPSSGTYSNMTSRLTHYATAPTWDLKVTFGNFAGESNGTANILIRASLESSNGTIHPLTFNGQQFTVIEPGGMVESDSCAVVLSKGDKFYSRTYVSTYPGDRWFLSELASFAEDEGLTPGSDLTRGGSVAASSAYIYAPMMITGRSRYSQPTIALIGDSIMRASDGDAALAFVEVALGPNRGMNFGHMNIGQVSEDISEFVTESRRVLRMRLIKSCKYAVVNHGINDMFNSRTFTQMTNDAVTSWRVLTNAGLAVYQCTLTPLSTSTDGWTTLVNQTTHANNAARVSFNDWVRTTPAPLTGYFEVADSVESSRNSGKWAVSPVLTVEGIHPNTAGGALMSATINTNLFIP